MLYFLNLLRTAENKNKQTNTKNKANEKSHLHWKQAQGLWIHAKRPYDLSKHLKELHYTLDFHFRFDNEVSSPVIFYYINVKIRTNRFLYFMI